MRNFLMVLGVFSMVVGGTSGCSSGPKIAAGTGVTLQVKNETGHAVTSRVADIRLRRGDLSWPVSCAVDEEGSGGPIALEPGESIDIHYEGCHDEVLGQGPVSVEIEYLEGRVDIARTDEAPARTLEVDFEYPATQPVMVVLE